MKERRVDCRHVSDFDRSAKKFFATFAQLERVWRQQPPSARKAREIKAVFKLVASIGTGL